MDLEDYDYGNRPYTTAKIFDIHALSKDGFNQYIGPNSYAHNYLNIVTPKLHTKFKSSERNLKNVSSNLSKFTIMEEKMNEENVETLINNEFQPSAIQQIKYCKEEKQLRESLDKQTKHFGYKTSNAFFNLNKPKSNYINNISNNKTLLNKTSLNFQSSKSNFDLVSRRLNFTSSNFRRTDSQHNNYTRFDKNYLSNINEITKKDFFKNNNKYENNHQKRFDGFLSFNVPRVKKLNIDSSKPMNKLAESISKSCVGNKRVSYVNAHSAFKLKEVTEENEKLKRIINRQTNTNFLKSTSLPDIIHIVSQPKLKIKKLNAGGKD